jgi:hypothetical protein
MTRAMQKRFTIKDDRLAVADMLGAMQQISKKSASI